MFDQLLPNLHVFILENTAKLFIILTGSLLAIISTVALFDLKFMKKMIRLQKGFTIIKTEISDTDLLIGKISAIIGVVGGVISLILTIYSFL